MRRLLLDTTFLIDTEPGDARLDDLADDDDVAIAAITVAELLVGVHLASGRRKARRKSFVDDLLTALDVVNYDGQVATEHARLLVATRLAGRPRGAHDLIIAATAGASDRVVVSADAVAFADLPGITVMNHRGDPSSRPDQ